MVVEVGYGGCIVGWVVGVLGVVDYVCDVELVEVGCGVGWIDCVQVDDFVWVEVIMQGGDELFEGFGVGLWCVVCVVFCLFVVEVDVVQIVGCYCVGELGSEGIGLCEGCEVCEFCFLVVVKY